MPETSAGAAPPPPPPTVALALFDEDGPINLLLAAILGPGQRLASLLVR